MQLSLMCNREKYSDNWETPPEFYKHIFPLVKDYKIWEPFIGVTNRSTKAMTALGLDVLETSGDFFQVVKNWPCDSEGKPRLLLSNPPFSEKFKVLEALVMAQKSGVKPFILLLPSWVYASATWRKLVIKENFKPQLYVPSLRLNFFSPKDLKQKKGTSFDTTCMCFGMQGETWASDLVYY